MGESAINEKKLTLGSLFDGSGGFPLAGMLAGIEPVWSSEVSPFCVLVTQKRLPQVKHYGDVSTLKGSELEPVDIITFGSPCQDLSIAGRRNGLHGKRSGLFFQATRIIKEMREATDGRYPRFAVYENVPGAFSSNNGEDFRLVLEEICKVKNREISIPRPEKLWTKAGEIVGDDYSIAWRTLDAQHWGCAQRRARIYLVADFDGQSAGKILFEREGLPRNPPSGGYPWQRVAGSTQDSSGETGTYCLNLQGASNTRVTKDFVATLVAQDHGNHPAVLQSAGFCTEHSANSRSIGYEEEKSPTLRAEITPAVVMFDNHAQDARYNGPLEVSPTVVTRFGTGGNNQPLVAEPEIKAYGVCSKHSNAMRSDNPKSGFYEAKTSRTLDRNGGDPTCAQGGIAVVETYDVRFTSEGTKNSRGHCYPTDISRCLDTAEANPDSNHGGVAVLEPVYCTSSGGFNNVGKDVSITLEARDWKDPPIVGGYIVRRLIPVECARLQGFPDWWCSELAIPEPTDEQIAFWKGVWDTWTRLNGKKLKTEKQVRKWLANPYTDKEEYSMWGNGIALPCAFFVLAGIAAEQSL